MCRAFVQAQALPSTHLKKRVMQSREHRSMAPDPHQEQEQERIRDVYRAWHGGAALARYAWHRPEILSQVAARSRGFAELLARTLGSDLGTLHMLDVGCGSGQFLRQLIDWGATPEYLTGTELQQDRLSYAQVHTAPGVHWHLGALTGLAPAAYDLVSAQTVFSSILDPLLRAELAAQMWQALRPGGWCLVFDFRYDNPRNHHVRKVTRGEMQSWWPGAQAHYRTLLLAPPLHRRLAWAPAVLCDLLTALVPLLRSHFLYMVQKQR